MAATRTPTELAAAAGQGDRRAADELFETLYTELRHVARNILKRQNSDETLQPTVLVHEAYLKLVNPEGINPTGTAHFRALAARAMRQVLIDHVRAQGRQKRGGRGSGGGSGGDSGGSGGCGDSGGGGSWRRVGLDDVFDKGAASSDEPDAADLMTVHETLNTMKQLDERLAHVVELRLFGGMTAAETAEVLGMSVRSVERDWAMGKAWLRRDLSGTE